MKYFKLYILLITSICCFSCSISPIEKDFISGSHIEILYNNTDVFRRSLLSAPKIGEGDEEVKIKLNCEGENDCYLKIGKIHALFTNNIQKSTSCNKPIFVKVSIFSNMEKYGLENKLQVYEVDYTGSCLRHNNEYYLLSDSVFNILLKLPINKW